MRLAEQDKKSTQLLILAIVLLAVAGAVGYKLWPRHPYDTISYPYICQGCKAVFDVSELKGDPGKWRIAPGGGSDSVVICPKCNKGFAYPVGTCETCGTQHILHLTRDSRCPKCFPEAAEKARKAGVDIFFKKP